jgi:predicted GIY-YIG superfamily endonuclease
MTDQGILPVAVQNETAAKATESAAKQRKSGKVLDGPTSLYKHYSKDKKLLYVGISLSALIRLAQHREKSAWFDEIHMIIVKKYPTRKAAMAAEKKLIQQRTPPYNTRHKPWTLAGHINKTFGSYENWLRYTNLGDCIHEKPKYNGGDRPVGPLRRTFSEG